MAPRSSKWLLSVLVVLAVASSAFATGCKKKKPETLRDDVAGIAITVPAGFKAGPLTNAKPGEPASSMRIQAGDYTKDIGVGVLSEAKVDLADITTLDGYVEVSNTNRANVLKNMAEKSRDTKRCGVHRCIELEIRGASNGMNLVYLVLYVETDTYFHQVQAWTAPSRLDANRATMQSVLDSYTDVHP